MQAFRATLFSYTGWSYTYIIKFNEVRAKEDKVERFRKAYYAIESNIFSYSPSALFEATLTLISPQRIAYPEIWHLKENEIELLRLFLSLSRKEQHYELGMGRGGTDSRETQSRLEWSPHKRSYYNLYADGSRIYHEKSNTLLIDEWCGVLVTKCFS